MKRRKKGWAELRQRKEHGEGKAKGRDDSHGDGREEKVAVSKKKDAGGASGGRWGGWHRQRKESGKVRTRTRTEGKRKTSKDEMKMER